MRIFVNALVVSLLAVLATSPAAAQATVDPTGHWEGTITAPMGQIDFEIDVVRDATSALSATYGQRASSVRGLPLTQVALDGRSFTFVLSTGGAGGGAFKGDILSDGKTISGDVKATVGSAPFTAYRTGEAVVAWKITNAIVSAALAGRWTGTLDAGGGQAVLQLTIANRENGTAFAQIAQASQPELRLEAALTERGGDVSIDVPAVGGSWKGALSGDSMAGTWTQAGSSLPLTFTRAK